MASQPSLTSFTWLVQHEAPEKEGHCKDQKSEHKQGSFWWSCLRKLTSMLVPAGNVLVMLMTAAKVILLPMTSSGEKEREQEKTQNI